MRKANNNSVVSRIAMRFFFLCDLKPGFTSEYIRPSHTACPVSIRCGVFFSYLNVVAVSMRGTGASYAIGGRVLRRDDWIRSAPFLMPPCTAGDRIDIAIAGQLLPDPNNNNNSSFGAKFSEKKQKKAPFFLQIFDGCEFLDGAHPFDSTSD